MKKLYFLIYIFFVLNICNHCFSQNYDWAINFGNPNNSNSDVNAIAVDSLGNSYLTGSFTGTISFGNISLTSNGNRDIFIAKYNNIGIPQWAVSAGGPGYFDEGIAISINNSGNVYVMGKFENYAHFGTDSLIADPTNYFLTKLDSTGNFIWAKKIGSYLNYGNPYLLFDYSCGIATDNFGNVYIAGSFEGTTNFGANSLTCVGLQDIFIAKYDSNGNNLWARQGGSIGMDKATSISVDVLGNCFITGRASNNVTFGNFTESVPNTGIFVVKYNSVGTVQWLTVANGHTTNCQNISSNGIGVDNFGNAYITGNFAGTVYFNSITLTSTGDPCFKNAFFIAKVNSSGVFQWAKKYESNNNNNAGRGIIVDNIGNSYVAGKLSEKVFVGANYNSGAQLWVNNQAGDFSWGTIATCIGKDGANNLYISGSFVSTITFGSTILTEASNGRLFLAKINNLTQGIKENVKVQLFSLYPNPTHDKIIISNIDISKVTHVSIFDLQGKEIYYFTFINKSTPEINVSKLSMGIYLVKIQAGDDIEFKKLVIK